MRRLVVATTRAVAVAYGLFDCGLRYLALYHPQSSTDAVVVAVLPFWWVPTVLVVAALDGGDALGQVPEDRTARLCLTVFFFFFFFF